MEENSQIDLLIVRRLTDSLTPDEERQLMAFIAESSINSKYVESFEYAWKSSSESSLFHKIDVGKDWQNVRNRMGFDRKEIKSISRRLLRVAAVLIPALILLSSLVAYYYLPGFGRLTAFNADNSKEVISLPDGSEVTLKKDSKLIVVRGLKGDERRVKLNGEAYFKVEKNSNHPFLLSISGAMIEVVGTAFNLENEGKKVTINVTEGIVRFYDKHNEILVHKGEEAVFDGKTIFKSKIEDNNFLAWKTGVMSFNDAGIIEILEVVIDCYNEVSGYKIDAKNKIKVTTVFNNQSMKEVIEELQIHFNKKIVLHDGILVISD